MNRKNLTAAVLAGLAGAAGIAGTAQAVNLNPDGLGQVLIYPYYTSNDGNATLLSVVNTTENAKAVKVRFLEGYNSREVLDFNLYMSHHDVWVAAIADGGDLGFPSQDGVPHLVIPDSSCTVPYLYGDQFVDEVNGGLQAFLPYAYTGNYEDGGPTSIARAGEGHFEMIEMGTLINEDTEITGKDARLGSADAATHLASTLEPADCEQLVENWTRAGSTGTDGLWIEDETLDMRRNSGGLFGGASVINVENGTMYSYDAKAIQGYDKKDYGNHFEPGDINPSLDDGSETTAWVFFGVPQNRAVALDYGRGVDAISAVFMHENIMNTYTIQEDINASTEWVVTFPTKNWYVDDAIVFAEDSFFKIWTPDPLDAGCNGWDPGEPNPLMDSSIWTAAPQNPDFGGNKPDPNDDREYFTEKGNDIWSNCTFVFDEFEEAIPPFTEVFDGEACELAIMSVWDREESPTADPDRPGQPPIVSPPPPPGQLPPEPGAFELCYEVNVLRFGDGVIFGTPEIEGSSLLLSISGTPDSGWANIEFPPVYDDDIERYRHVDQVGLVGLPVTGFAAEQYENGFIGANNDVLSNYGGLFGHKANVRRMNPRISSL